jgi:hypothetical protein
MVWPTKLKMILLEHILGRGRRQVNEVMPAAIRFQPTPLARNVAIPANTVTFCGHRMDRRPIVKSRPPKCYKTREPPQFLAAPSRLFA